jgi:heavy metal sensor kinase
MILPIRVRLTLWYAALLALTVAAIGAFLVLQLKSDLVRATDDEARTTSTAIILELVDETSDGEEEVRADDPGVIEEFMEAADASLAPSDAAQLLAADGTVLARHGVVGTAGSLAAGRVRAEPSGTERRDTVRLGTEDEQYRVHATSFRFGDEQRVLLVALSLERVDDAVQRVLVLLLFAAAAALAGTGMIAYWLARKALHPVDRMTEDARAIEADRLDERVAVPRSRDEIRRLAVTLNAMLDRIERGVADKRRLVADASHELRTPLAVMRAEIDVSLRADVLSTPARDVLASARQEVDRISRAVDNLLALAEADEGRIRLLTADLDVRRVIEDAATPMRLLAQAKGVELRTGGDSLELRGDARRLHLAVTNLIENAVKFTPSGGLVEVNTWRSATGEEGGVTVADGGPGISPEDQERLFERFYRVDNVHGRQIRGTGLGLAICREVVHAHGGRLWVESAPGQGSTFHVSLPRRVPSPPPDPDSLPVPQAELTRPDLTPRG